jgi:hypothetical protein
LTAAVTYRFDSLHVGTMVLKCGNVVTLPSLIQMRFICKSRNLIPATPTVKGPVMGLFFIGDREYYSPSPGHHSRTARVGKNCGNS